MKTLITVALLLTTNANAQNFMRYDDLRDGLNRGFQLQSECERGGFECFSSDLAKVDEQSVVYDDVDDPNKPLYSSPTDITPCATPLACNIVIQTLCESPKLPFYRNILGQETFEAYCVTITGYEQKQKPRLADDAVKIAAKQVKAQQAIQKRIRQESVEALALGEDIIVDIRVLNRAKIAAGTLNFQTLLSSQDAANIERLLRSGSLETAKPLIQSIQGFYTTQEKATIISRIDAHLQKWAN